MNTSLQSWIKSLYVKFDVISATRVRDEEDVGGLESCRGSEGGRRERCCCKNTSLWRAVGRGTYRDMFNILAMDGSTLFGSLK